MFKITKVIQNVLPELTQKELDEVATKLINEIGVINEKKLKYVRECDLAAVGLKPAQCHELLEA